MSLERVPADIRKHGSLRAINQFLNDADWLMTGGVARMVDPVKVKEIKSAVTIPVMAKARIGHFVEAQVSVFVMNILRLNLRRVADSGSAGCRLHRRVRGAHAG